MNRPHIVRAAQASSPVFEPGSESGLGLLYFDLIQMKQGESRVLDLPGFEIHLVPFTGRMDVQISGLTFEGVGGRDSLWDGPADSIYAGTARNMEVHASTDLELAVAGGRTDGTYKAFRISPQEVQCVDVGSSETKSRRRICHLLGHNGIGRAGNLLVSELYAEEGCWSGYPPHKHDTDRSDDGATSGTTETDHEEMYHFRYRPETGFGAQFLYVDGLEPAVEMVRNGDSFAIPRGYHPTVTSPGHDEYIFTVLVGRTRRGLVQYFDPIHEHLVSSFPGIAGMRKAFA